MGLGQFFSHKKGHSILPLPCLENFEKRAEYKEQATIMIPSYKRKKLLEQLLGYLDKLKVPFNILLLVNDDEYQDLIACYVNLDIKIVVFQESETLMSKLHKGSKLVETPFICICTDDDLVLVESLLECIDFLQENPSYTACQGYHGLFEQQDKDIFIHNFLWKSGSLDSENPMHRLSDLFQAYNPVCWAVFRSYVFKRTMEKLTGCAQLKGIFQELIWSALPVIYGKVKRLPVLYCLRRSNELNHEWHPFYAFLSSPSIFFRDYLEFKRCLSEEIETLQYTKDQMGYILDLICTKYLVFDYDRSKLCFLLDSTLNNSHLNIYSREIFNVIKIYPLKIDKGKFKKVKYESICYYFSKKFFQKQGVLWGQDIRDSKFLVNFTAYFESNTRDQRSKKSYV